MIDVQRLQKLNQLASDLLEHGFAQDREDAMRQADETLKNKSTAVSIRHMGSTPPLDSNEKPLSRSQPPSAQTVQDAPAQGYTPDWHTLYRNLNKKIEEQNNQIQALVARTKQLDEEVTTLKNRPLTIIAPENASHTQALPTPAPVDAPVKEPAEMRQANADIIDANTGRAIPVHAQKQNSPRTGGYSPKDVSIEKMFYSGARP